MSRWLPGIEAIRQCVSLGGFTHIDRLFEAATYHATPGSLLVVMERCHTAIFLCIGIFGSVTRSGAAMPRVDGYEKDSAGSQMVARTPAIQDVGLR